MPIALFDQPKYCGYYLQVGAYEDHPLYVGEKPNKEWVAMATDDGNGICVNIEAYRALSKSPKVLCYLENICEHELSNGVVHEHDSDRPESDKEIMQYLKQQGILQ
jgi:hypothetical protein